MVFYVLKQDFGSAFCGSLVNFDISLEAQLTNGFANFYMQHHYLVTHWVLFNPQINIVH
jgi:hypothetical protein